MGAILGTILVLIVTITSIVFVVFFQRAPETPNSKTFIITDSEQWIHEALGEIDLLIVIYEKEKVDNGNSVKTIQIVQTERQLTFLNNGEWMHYGEEVAISTNHDSNFTVDILDQHYLEDGLENLRYNIIFGNEVYNSNIQL